MLNKRTLNNTLLACRIYVHAHTFSISSLLPLPFILAGTKNRKKEKKLEGCRDGGVVSVKEVVEEEEEIKWQGSYEMCV